MPTTTCTTCGKLYEESSEELANAPKRDCMDCWMAARTEENLRRLGEAESAKGMVLVPVNKLTYGDCYRFGLDVALLTSSPLEL